MRRLFHAGFSAEILIHSMGAWLKKVIWRIGRAFLFSFDAETAHHLTLRLIRIGIRLRIHLRWWRARRPGVASRVFGVDFHGRLGLAAGLDKNAEILEALPAMGFAFAEIGTVTPRPQPGNDRPRLFRKVIDQTIFNRMGFNNLGATLVAERVRSAKKSLPPWFRVGVNLGKNKDTSLEDAASDYARAAAPFRDLADYLVINVSSPNTPGLRSLQNAEQLEPIVRAVQGEIRQWASRPPLLLKLAPEMEGNALQTLLKTVETWSIDGLVLTNTLGGTFEDGKSPLAGGWSGRILTDRSRQSLITARSVTRLPIISVGGIMDGDEARKRIDCGAELIQIYSGWIFEGPSLVREILGKLQKNP